jgi:hypothetical protein
MKNLKSKRFAVRIGKARCPGLVIEVAKQKTPADMFEYDAEAVTFYVETFSNFSLLDTYVERISLYTYTPPLRKLTQSPQPSS